MTEQADHPIPDAPAVRRPIPWSAVCAGAVIFFASGAFLFSLDLERPDRSATSASAKAPILGLNDPATKRADSREAAPRPKVVRCAKNEGSCGAEALGWCDLDVGFLACCEKGSIATPTKSCVCPPGGSAVGGSTCPLASAQYRPELALEPQRDRLKLCHESASRRNPIGATTFHFAISAEGLPVDVRVESEGSKDATFEDCVSGFIEEARFPPPPEGFFDAVVAWKFE